jgi:hypothetical protein
MTGIIDVNVDPTPHLDGLKAAGIETIIGYLDPIGPRNPKCLTPARVKAIAAAGMRAGLVSEGWGDFAHGAISAGAGERDAAFALKMTTTLGAPDGACVYFAIDVDASAMQVRKLVLPYFAAIRTALALRLKVGVYGSGAVCAAVLDAGLADHAWLACSMGWTGSRAFLASRRWALRQHLPATIAGVPCDADDAGGECGDFVPFATSP